MESKAFWDDILSVIDDGFLPNGLQKLERYAEQFISGRLVYKRFSPSEQRGCSAGGCTHVVASLLAGAEVATDNGDSQSISNRQAEFKHGTKQESYIEKWANKTGIWYDYIDGYDEDENYLDNVYSLFLRQDNFKYGVSYFKGKCKLLNIIKRA